MASYEQAIQSVLATLGVPEAEVARLVSRFEAWRAQGDPRGANLRAGLEALLREMGSDESTLEPPTGPRQGGQPPLEEEAPTLLQLEVPAGGPAPGRPAEPSLQRPVLAPGDRVDQYEVIRPLGQGGMGAVYLARDVLLGRKAALKVVHPHLVGTPEAVERFLFEARATARFNHPHIVTIYGLGQVHGCPYVALEYLEGRTLRDRLRAGLMPPREAAALMLRVARALAEAHRQSVLHCDLKPENILLPRDGRLRVVDFGLAQLLHKPDPGAEDKPTRSPAQSLEQDGAPAHRCDSETRSGGAAVLRGTAAYMAPEQWLGDTLGPATDVWAFGVVLHELLTGSRPVDGSTVQVYQRVTAPDFQMPPPETTDDRWGRPLATLCSQCLQRDPLRRPRTEDLVETLARLCDHPDAGPHHAAGDDGAADVGADGSGAPEEALPSPFRGLAPFHRRHAAWFFGRDAESEAAVERLRETPLLAVVGASGAGKSSFVQAGILPRLEVLGPWEARVLRPGRRPFHALADRLLRNEDSSLESTPASLSEVSDSDADSEAREALARRLQEEPTLLGQRLRERARARGTSVLLLVDQLEEIFTLCDDEEVRARFCAALLYAADDAASPVRVVLTLREDFLSRLARFPELIQEVTRGIVVVRTPGPEALREILQAPVARLGYRFEDPELVREMVTEVEHEPAGLPLLQFAATRLWEARDREARCIRRTSYEAIGGVAGALAEHADAVLDGLVGEAAEAARQVLLRLVTPEGTRTAKRWADLVREVGPGAETAIEHLVNARLLVPRRGPASTGEDTEVELVHESLISRWRRLGRWMEESREEVALRAELEAAVAQWERRGRRDEDLWRGRALAEALDYQRRHPDGLPQNALPFLERSARAERQQASRRVRRQAAALVGGVLLLATMVTLLWVRRQEQRARRARTEAIAARAQARQRMAAALLEGAESAYLRGDYHDARAKLRASFEVADSTRARALFAALARDPLRFRARHPESVFSVALSPDGHHVATGAYDGTIRIWDRETGAVRVLRGHRKEVFSLTYAPDGASLLSGAGDGDVRLWSLPDGHSRVVTSHVARVLAVAYGPSGSQLASASGDGVIKVLRTGGKTPLRLTGHHGRVTGLRFAPGGERLVSSGADGTLRVWRLPTGRVTVLPGSGQPLECLDLSPSGTQALTGDSTGEVRRWDLRRETSRPLARLQRAVHAVAWPPSSLRFAVGDADGTLWLWHPTEHRFRALGRHRDRVSSLAYGPRGLVLASGSFDRTLQVWDPSIPPPPQPSGHTGWVSGVAFRPDGRELASASQDKTVRLWDVESGSSRPLVGHTGRVMAVAYRFDGKELASAGFDHTVRLWHLDGTSPRVLRGHTGPIYAVAYRPPDGTMLATASADRTVRLWELPSGRSWVLRGHRDRVFGVAFAPSGRRLVSASWDGTLRIWDVASRQVLRVLRGHQGRVSAVAWSPAGRVVASGSYDRTVRLWDPYSGQTLRVLTGHTDYVWGVAFSPDGRRLASASRDRTVRIWQVATGKLLRRLRGHTLDVNRVAFSPDGTLLASGSDDTTVRLWHLPSGTPAWQATALLPGQEPRLATGRGLVPFSQFGEHPPTPPVPPSTPSEAALVTALSHAAGMALPGPEGHLLAWVTRDAHVVLWSLRLGRRLWRRRWPGATQAVPIGGDRVLVLARGAAHRLGPPPTPSSPVIAQGARYLVVGADRLLVISNGQVHLLDRRAHSMREVPVAPGATAAALLPGRRLLVGFRDGTVESILAGGRPDPTHRPFEAVPAVPITALSPGRAGTLGLALRDGTAGLWDLHTGKRLASRRLHGPVVLLHRVRQHLYLASALGDTAQIDLSVFHASACEILRRIWNSCPAVWDNGRATRRPPPPGHRCSRRLTRSLRRRPGM